MNQFDIEHSLSHYLALALFESMYPHLNSYSASDNANQWAKLVILPHDY